MVEHACCNDRVIAGEGSGHVGDALAGADAKLVLLDVDRVPAELRRRQLHRIAGAGARLLKIKRDALVLQHARGRLLRKLENPVEVRGCQVADREQMSHQLFSFVTIVPTPWSVSSSISSEWFTRPSMMCAKRTPWSTASAQALSLGIMPLPTLSWLIRARNSAEVSRGINVVSSLGSSSNPGTAVK